MAKLEDTISRFFGGKDGIFGSKLLIIIVLVFLIICTDLFDNFFDDVTLSKSFSKISRQRSLIYQFGSSAGVQDIDTIRSDFLLYCGNPSSALIHSIS